MREEFSRVLVRLAKMDPKVILLTGDHGYALFDSFRKECPEQYINAGIAEQNMVGMAAGLAKCGFKPVVYGLAAFIPIRVMEQIKLDIAHDNLPVIFIGDGAGLVYSHLGTSHQSCEDIACTRAIPNLSIYSPADMYEIAACMNFAHKKATPSYIRIGKSDKGKIHNEYFNLSRGDLMSLGELSQSKVSIIATGSMVTIAKDLVSRKFIDANLWSSPVIKPINKKQVIEIALQSELIVTMEEHSVIGGLGSLICEIVSESAPVKMLRIGIQDQFSHSCGSYDHLLKEHEVDIDSIKKKLLISLQQLNQ